MNEATIRYSTTTCTTLASSTECVQVYNPEVTTLDFIFVTSIIVFLLLPNFWRMIFSPFNKGKIQL